MTRCTAHMAQFCACRFKRDTFGDRLRRKARHVKRLLTPRLGARPHVGITWEDWTP